jgi:hypothetical protein
MIVIDTRNYEWQLTTHDSDNPSVLRKYFPWGKLLGRNLSGVSPFFNFARLVVGGYFGSHHHGEKGKHLQDPNNIGGMDEVFVPLSGVSLMSVEGKDHFSEFEVEPGMVVLVEKGELHAMRNIGEVPFDYFVYGVSNGGNTFAQDFSPSHHNKPSNSEVN